jgi:hypothetical protein
MPTSPIEDDDRVRTRRDVAADFRQMQVHGLRVDLGQDQADADATRGADRAEDIGPIIALIARRAWAAAALGPDVGQAALLADPGLILPPEFKWLVARGWRQGRIDQRGKVFLCAS